ncbi:MULTISPECIES: DMT family transporter [Halorussus]|uniref:DMT family transporter n=1 Tax=Halorussus TaxID=1070314 RepID=UPI00209FFC81|nr:DMT family transporter [Halorussus vallis]USZ77414.1 DMT family transporter [Halorussus vallis]
MSPGHEPPDNCRRTKGFHARALSSDVDFTARERVGPRGIAVGLFAFVALAWGGSYVAITVGLRHVPPVLFAAGRLDTAAAVVLPVVALRYDEWLPKTRDDWLAVLASGVFAIAAANGFLFVGQQFTTSAAAAVVFALNPVLATAFAWVLVTDERLGLLELLGVLLGIVGVGIVASPDPRHLFDPANAGTWIVLCGAASLALGSVLSRRFSPRIPTLATTGWGLLVGALLLHLVSLGLGESASGAVPFAVVVALAYLGVVSTAGAYSAYFDLIDRVGAVRTALVSYVVPVVAALLGWLLVDEAVTLRTVVGFAIVAVGFALTERRRVLAGLRRTVAPSEDARTEGD